MAAQLQARAYLDLVSSSSGDEDPSSSSKKASALQGFLDAVSGAEMGRLASMEVQMRRGLAQALLNQLEKMASAQMYEENTEDHVLKVLSLQCLKELSRLPGGSNVQSEPTGMRTLLKHVVLPPALATPFLHNNLQHRQQHPSIDASDSSSVTSNASATSGLSAALQRVWKTRSDAVRKERKGPPTAAVSEDVNDITALQMAPENDESSSREMRSADWIINDTALRCLNNALVLHETSRRAFADDSVGGARKIIGLLRNPSQTPADIIFLASRLLFFSTLFDATFNKVAVEEEHLIEHLASCLYALTSALQRPRSDSHSSFQSSSSSSSWGGIDVPVGSVPQVKTALAEALKVVFNLGLYYPRLAEDVPKGPGRSGSDDSTAAKKDPAIVGGAFNERLAVLLDPVVQLILALPTDSLTMPTTNAIGVLLNFPIKPYRASWFQNPPLLQDRRASASSVASNGSSTAKAGRFFTSSSTSQSSVKRLGNSVFHSRGSSGGPSTHTTLRSVPESTTTATSKERSRASSLSSSSSAPSENRIPLIDHLLALLESFTSRYFPPNALSTPEELDTDDRSTRLLAQQDGDVQLEEVGQPVQLLLRKLCVEDGEIRRAIKRRILPDDIDRTVGLDKRPDLTGRLIRLLSSVTYSRLGRVAGELLLAICQDDPRELVAQVGYGPCAGFLVAKGFGDAFPTGDSQPAGTKGKDWEGTRARISEIDDEADDGVRRPAIDPITGAYIVPPPLPPKVATAHHGTPARTGVSSSSTPTAASTKQQQQQAPVEGEMTEEEKELEAERLFGLFDRLDRTGIIKVRNPLEQPASQERIRLAQQEEQRKKEDLEAREEQEALRDLARWKARKAP